MLLYTLHILSAVRNLPACHIPLEKRSARSYNSGFNAMKKQKVLQKSKKFFAIIAICFTLSGACSLIFELTWSKYFSLLLGGTIFGVATVVAAFMGGLGLGSYVGGRISIRLRNHVRAYAWLEGSVGLFALLSPFIFTHIEAPFALFYNLSHQSFAFFLLLRFLVLFMLLMIPTVAMGASLPLLVEYMTRKEPQKRGYIGFLYALNTIGAVLGTAVGGFFFVPKFGLAITTIIASIVDLGIFAFLFMRPFPPALPDRAAEIDASIQTQGLERTKIVLLGSNWQAWKGIFIALLFGISGLLAMIYQVGWTRILIVSLGSSVYCFAIILVLYLSGLSVGAGVVARIAEKTPSPLAWFCLLEGIVAITTYLGSYWFGQIPALTGWAFRSSGGNPFAFFVNETIIAAPIVLPPTLAMGALFPFAARSYRDVIGKTGSAVGTIYAANTMGTIIGSLGTGFLLIPLFGALQSIMSASIASAIIAIMALVIASGARPLKIAAALLSITAAAGAFYRPPLVRFADSNLNLVTILRGERAALSSPPSLSSQAEPASTAPLSDTPAIEQCIFYREGLNATVAVGADDRDRFLLINGKGDASTSEKDMITQMMLGHLPMIFAPEAADVLVIGLGAGVTTHAVLTHPSVTRVDTIEIEAAVVEASAYFRDINQEPLKDPRHHILVDDARVYLAYNDRKYDVIISEPSNPWIAGINNLFTREFYRHVDEKLRSGGVFCQWLQAYEISQNSILVILRTINDVFPDAHIFILSEFGDMLIIARKPPFKTPLPEKVFSIPAVAEDMTRIRISNPALLGRFYKTSIRNLLSGSKNGVRNTDDNCYLEHVAPLELIDPTTRLFNVLVRKAYFNNYHELFYPERPAAQVLLDCGLAAARYGDLNYTVWAYEILEDRGLLESAALLHPEMLKAKQRKEIKDQIQLYLQQANQLVAKGQKKEGIEILKKAGALDPHDNKVLSKAALLLMEMEQNKLAEQMFRELIRRNDIDYLYMALVNLGVLLCQRQAYSEGLKEFNTALEVNPYPIPAYYYGSLALESLGRMDEAINLMRKGLPYGSDDPVMLRQLASFLEIKGNADEARRLRSRANRLAK